MIVFNKKILIFILLFINSITCFAYNQKCVPDSVIFNDILGCYINEYNKYDKKLNGLYTYKISKLSKVKKNKLKNSQREWIKLKESLCVADEKNYGRESHFDAMQCQIDMTKERILFLEKYN